MALTQPGWGTMGILGRHLWSFAGDEEADNVNSFLFQPILNYNLPNQWYLTSVPIITANWDAVEGNRWTVPVGGGFGKIFRVGSQAFNGSFQAFYNVEHPTFTGGPPPGGLPPEDSSSAAWTLRSSVSSSAPPRC